MGGLVKMLCFVFGMMVGGAFVTGTLLFFMGASGHFSHESSNQ